MEYILEVKQIVDYPRVRIYREFIQTLINHKELSVKGNCNLFNYIVLCCYANYSTSRKRIDGKQYFIAPGEWICSIKDLMKWFKLTKSKSLAILESLQKKGVIEYELLKEHIFYKIIDWDKYNSYMEYEAHCQKDDGFFFFYFEYIDKFLVQSEKCSEKDILMDLWLNTIYNDASLYNKTVKFNTFSEIVVKNELLKYCKKANRKIKTVDIPNRSDIQDLLINDEDVSEILFNAENLKSIRKVKNKYSGVVLKGIEAIELKMQGLVGSDIAAMYDVKPNYISAWVAKAKQALNSNENFIKEISCNF